MKTKKISVFYKDKLIEKNPSLDNKLKDLLKNHDVKYIEYNKLNKKDLDCQDLVITIGGDGTFAKAANLIENALIIGINSHPETSEGALISLDINEIEKLSSILNGDFNISMIYRVQTKLNEKILDELAINEVYVGAASQFHSSRYKIKYKDKEEEQRSSGVIISTGAGSPAWLHSAGGKIFPRDEEKLSFVVREPYFGKKIFKPTILNGDLLKGEKLTFVSERDFGGIVAIGDSVYDFNKGDIVEIELSNKPLKTVIPIK
ncbi:NAD(+)/NADH kinase [Candidatus Pacearchaeota archaeon]|nr:NAD(+)/NADH kinase [Candidatus Pacearchaeota archaeon]